jgi:hypothetical protein
MSMEELGFVKLSIEDESELVAEIKKSLVRGESTIYKPTDTLLEMTVMKGDEASNRRSQFLLLTAVAIVQLELSSQDHLQLHLVQTSVVGILSAWTA